MKKTIIYYLQKNKEKAENIFFNLISETQKDNAPIRIYKSAQGHRAIFENGNSVEMRRASENIRGLMWSTAYIDNEIDLEIVQTTILPAGKGSKDSHYF